MVLRRTARSDENRENGTGASTMGRGKVKESAAAATRNAAFRRVVASIPKGRVATYGQVAAAAGYPLYHRAVARFLQGEPTNRLPWQRVVGAGGEIKLAAEAAAEQRLRLRMEGVAFRGRRVDLKVHQYTFARALPSFDTVG